MKRKWWQDAIIYQCYIRSFYDKNNDGIGDFKGLIEKIDYFDELGVNAVWVSPHYKSPMDDNGYDISDFYQVSEDYGTLEDVKEFIALAHSKNIKVIFDLVLNHTSDEHEWFKIACDPTHPEFDKYHDYYIWQDPKYDEEGNMQKPTRWLSWFGGGVWDYIPAVNKYYLHIFSKKMPDLNWRSKDMVKDLKKMTKWLIDLGVDGFRVDASNHLEKNWDFPDAYPGYENFSSLPKHHEYLSEFGEELFVPNDVMAMGEAGGGTPEEAEKYVGFNNTEFDMLIQFGHCWQDGDWDNKLTPGKWAKGNLYVKGIKESFSHWAKMLDGVGWNLIYWHNHDQPRVISHYGNDKEYWEQSGKMLCQSLYLMPGTSIVYQGEEIGMTNVDYENLSDFRDVEVFTEYENFIGFGASNEIAMQALRDRSRDNARSPFQWNDTTNAGFSNNTPWINTVGNYKEINLEKQRNEENSIFKTYQKVFKLRKELALSAGKVTFYDLEGNDTFMYKNETKENSLFVLSNFKGNEITVKIDEELLNYKFMMSNYDKIELQKEMILRPYESAVFIRK
ncbi:Oligo-1,6-glucosidase [Candidatus Izimaplasma bacterium HR1]|jgi:glycosidase|uniref:alpha-glucosidase n=1 Tax=Candidatus Izimoplasma sp. HR1 TaxID=1541959 RepID=UPI0004F881CD|nr:Oligo-1,6-glucosidase [Candidatus Izimaplasma bacterium HR1]